MLVDSHCHLQLIDYDKLNSTEADVVANAKAAGVEQLLCVATDLEQSQALHKLVDRYDNVDISIGVHPCGVMPSVTLENILEHVNHPKVVAIGETGLDYYHNTEKDFLKVQQELFRLHIRAAKQSNKALIIHSRNAREDTCRILQEEQAVKGVMHCFTESLPMAERCIELGFYISFSGIASFKNAKELQEVVKAVPLDKILIETDSPYLAPVPMRGKVNQPAYVKYVAETVAKLKDVSVENVAKITTENYFKLFHNN